MRLVENPKFTFPYADLLLILSFNKIVAEISSIDLDVEKRKERNSFSPHHLFHFSSFILAIFQRGIFRVRPSFVSNLRQSLR